MQLKALLLFLFLVVPISGQAHDIPMSLAGIRLGSDVSTVKHCCKITTDIPLSDERHLNEIDLMPEFVPGIKSGTVAYANCSKKGAIVRIKLKFDNSSRSFFDDLLDRYTDKFGKPIKWRGNPFQTVLAWKWSFSDSHGQKINLELTHSNDDDYKIGNFVKMTSRSLWEEEEACYKKTLEPADGNGATPTPPEKLDYRQLIPN